jgi:hypothetical protein
MVFKGNRWSEKEMRTLAALYPDVTKSIDDLLKALPKRSYSAIYSKANNLKLPLRSDAMQRGLEEIIGK